MISPIFFEDQLFRQFIATNYCLANRGQLKEEFPTRAWIRTHFNGSVRVFGHRNTQAYILFPFS